MFLLELLYKIRWVRLGLLLHLLGGSRPGAYIRGPRAVVAECTKSLDQQTEELCEGEGGPRAKDKSFADLNVICSPC